MPLERNLGRSWRQHAARRRCVSQILPARLGISAAALGLLFFSGQAAGIAAMGGAIGVPLWIVFGAGGTFAGVLIDEIKKRKRAKP